MVTINEALAHVKTINAKENPENLEAFLGAYYEHVDDVDEIVEFNYAMIDSHNECYRDALGMTFFPYSTERDFGYRPNLPRFMCNKIVHRDKKNRKANIRKFMGCMKDAWQLGWFEKDPNEPMKPNEIVSCTATIGELPLSKG